MKIKEITDIMDLLEILEDRKGVEHFPIEKTIQTAKLEPNKIFVAVSVGGDEVAIIRKNPTPKPFQFVDVQAEIAITFIKMEHFPRIVPLIYDKVYFLC
jgi:hypothetical protein